MTVVHRQLDTMHRIDVRADELAPVRLRRVLDRLGYPFPDTVFDTLKLAATELVTNAVRHSGARERGENVVVFVRVGPPSLLVKVCDRGPGVPDERPEPDALDEGGRGLLLVDVLSHRWGTSRVEVDGQTWSCVWACFGEEALPECAAGI